MVKTWSILNIIYCKYGTRISVRRICVSLVKFWLCMVIHLVDRPLCLLSFASFLLLFPHNLRGRSCFLSTVVIFSGMKNLLHVLISPVGCDELTTHPLFPIGCKGSLTGMSLWGRDKKVLAFDYIAGMQCGEEWSSLCSPSRSEYQVLESGLYLFPVLDITVTKLL